MWPVGRTSLIRAVASTAIIVGSAVPAVAFCYWRISLHPSEWPWGHDNFVDFVCSFFGAAYQRVLPPTERHAWIGLGLVALLTSWGLAQTRRSDDRVARLLLLILVFSVAALIASRVLLGTLWPFPRTILFLIPLMIFVLLYAPLGALRRYHRATLVVSCALVGLQLLSTVSSVDPRLHHGWQKYAAVRAALSTIDAYRGDQGSAIVSLPVEMAVCVEYDLMRRPRPGLKFDLRRPWGSNASPRPEADFAIGWSADAVAGWQWRGHILVADLPSGVVVLHRD
ncbi:MAG: hypothetical protein IH987_17605 [Planctomycetes bacterium]|nr:hypothetical protein [Planctomycetota bacterium]